MRNRGRMLATILVALSLGFFCFNRSFAQDKKDHGGYGGGHQDKETKGGGMQPGEKMTPEQQKQMEDAMMKAGMPGPEHQEMIKGAGDWDAEVKFMDMGTGQWSPPMKGAMHMEPILDGRYMMMKFEGTMDMGGQKMPFKGMGIMGYDNVRKKYFSTWIDSMSTGMMHSEGTKQGNVTTLMGMMTDPMSGKEIKCKEIATHADDTHMKYEMFCEMAPGQEMKMMEINYTKKK